jgi:hypothetical protein
MRTTCGAVLLTGALAAAVCGASGTSGASGAGTPGAAGGRPAEAASSAPEVLGTIRAALDGVARTWYVVSGTSRGKPYASGAWQDRANGRRVITIGGFDTAAPPLDTFEWNDDGTPRSYGAYTGSVLSLMLTVGPDGPPFRFVYPPERVPAVIYASRATLDSLDTTFQIVKGTVEVSAVSVAGGLASAAGAFSGTLSGMVRDGTVAVSNGTFDVKNLPNLAGIGRLAADDAEPR